MTRLREGWATLRARLETALWLVPAIIVAAAGATAFALVRLDRAIEEVGTVAFTGGPDSARSVLSTIASSMLTLTGLVFSITIVVLQLASTQFSPRVLRTFLQDRTTQHTLGVFLASFAYALLVLREVRGEAASVDEFVPGLSITFGFLLVALSLALFVRYIHHIAQSIRVVTILRRIGAETEQAIVERYPEEDPGPRGERPGVVAGPPQQTVLSPRSGVIIALEVGHLVDVAHRAGGVVVLRHGVGAFVPQGGPLADAFGGAVDDDELCSAVAVGAERTMHADPAFGFRQLVDIAERAVSPGINDPSTAVQVLDQLHHLLRLLAGRSTEIGAHRDGDGVVRVVIPEPDWQAYLALATREILHWGRTSLIVTERLRSMLEDLSTVVTGADLDAVRRLQAHVAEVIAERGPDTGGRDDG